MFFMHCFGGHVKILLVYVNDITIRGNDCEEIINLENLLAYEFVIKFLGRLQISWAWGFPF